MGFNLTKYGMVFNAFCHLAAFGLWPVFYLTVSSEKYTNWTVFFIAWGGLPLLDVLCGEDTYNLSPKEEKRWKAFIGFNMVTWLHTPLHFAGLWFAVTHVVNNDLDWVEWLGLVFSCGTIAGFGIGCVHEMIHSKLKLDFLLALLSMTLSWHSHFALEHIYGHHRNVATSLDCASSDLGDNVWFFVPKCMAWTFVEACQIEAGIVRMKYKTHWFTFRNRILQGLAVSAFWNILCYEWYGLAGVKVMLAVAFLTQWICDNTNYIEHYGLRRKIMVESGKYEVVWWVHSWDTPNVLTNTLLFKIQRHPDHHTNANRPYQILRTYKHAPQLPTGYAGCIVLSWIPWIWRWIMDPKVEECMRFREEYETQGTINGVEFIFPKGHQAVSSHDDQVDKYILYEKASWMEIRRTSTTVTEAQWKEIMSKKEEANDEPEEDGGVFAKLAKQMEQKRSLRRRKA